MENFGPVEGSLCCAIFSRFNSGVRKLGAPVLNLNFGAGSHRVVETKQELGLVAIQKLWIKMQAGNPNIKDYVGYFG